MKRLLVVDLYFIGPVSFPSVQRLFHWSSFFFIGPVSFFIGSATFHWSSLFFIGSSTLSSVQLPFHWFSFLIIGSSPSGQYVIWVTSHFRYHLRKVVSTSLQSGSQPSCLLNFQVVSIIIYSSVLPPSCWYPLPLASWSFCPSLFYQMASAFFRHQ